MIHELTLNSTKQDSEFRVFRLGSFRVLDQGFSLGPNPMSFDLEKVSLSLHRFVVVLTRPPDRFDF
ncbi:hypothetical protein BH18ACI4_BH18ACI4_04390 [soil metagenome]